MIHHTRTAILNFIGLAVFLLMSACGTTTATHPGAVNSFDSTTYDALLTAQAAIEAAKPLATTPALKTAVNAAIQAYDVAESAYVAYHAAAVAGTATTAQQSALQTQVNSLTTAAKALPVGTPVTSAGPKP
jgi:hypothetical protein